LTTMRFLKSLVSNPYLWGGLALMAAVAVSFYFVVDDAIMPAYTRHDVAIAVPDVTHLPFHEASNILASYNLQVEREEQRHNPDLARDEVVDQEPKAHALVKPGRRVYLTVNSGTIPMIVVPAVYNLSIREARNRMVTIGLSVTDEDVQPDSIPSPDPNTVTFQDPPAGTSVPLGSHVKLLYSTGLGDEYTSVPDVTGLEALEARQFLLDRRIRSVVIGGDSLRVQKQSPEPGTRVREGFEVRLFTSQ